MVLILINNSSLQFIFYHSLPDSKPNSTGTLKIYKLDEKVSIYIYNIIVV